LHRFGDLLFLRATPVDVGRRDCPGIPRLRIRPVPDPLQARPRPNGSGLDYDDGRAGVPLPRSAAEPPNPGRVPLAHPPRATAAARGRKGYVVRERTEDLSREP